MLVIYCQEEKTVVHFFCLILRKYIILAFRHFRHKFQRVCSIPDRLGNC